MGAKAQLVVIGIKGMLRKTFGCIKYKYKISVSHISLRCINGMEETVYLVLSTAVVMMTIKFRDVIPCEQ